MNFKFSFVMPIFNSEKYLDEAIQSVLSQTMDFESNCQIIFVNDGSTDGSEGVCLKYKNLYPDNIVYISQSNSGPEVARNKGLDFIEGKYVSFLDSDDRLSHDSLDEVYSFFEGNYDKIDFISIKMHMFDAVDKPHPLNYKFAEDKIVNIKDDYKYIQSTIGNVFVKSKVFLDGWRFRVEALNVADADFLTRLVMGRGAYGVLEKPTYYYRKHESSLTYSEKNKPEFYTVQPEKGYIAMLEYSLDRLGYVSKYVQWVLLYYIRGHVKSNVLFSLNRLQYIKYIENIKKILEQIDDDILADSDNGMNAKTRLYLLNLKHGEDVLSSIELSSDQVVSWSRLALYRLKSVKTRIVKLYFENNKLILEGYYTGFKLPNVKFSIKAGNARATIESVESVNVGVKVFGSIAYEHNFFIASIDVSNLDSAAPLDFSFIINNSESVRLNKVTVDDLPRLTGRQVYITYGDAIVMRAEGKLFIQRNSSINYLKRRAKSTYLLNTYKILNDPRKLVVRAVLKKDSGLHEIMEWKHFIDSVGLYRYVADFIYKGITSRNANESISALVLLCSSTDDYVYAKEYIEQYIHRSDTDSPSILLNMFNVYDKINEWSCAEDVANKLLDIDSSNPDYIKLLNKSTVYSSGSKRSIINIQGMILEATHGTTVDEIARKISKAIGIREETPYEYLTLGGADNLGVFIHKSNTKRYFTKASIRNQLSINEEMFYRLVSSKGRDSKLVPGFVECLVWDGISYIILEYVNIKRITRNANSVKRIISAVGAVDALDAGGSAYTRHSAVRRRALPGRPTSLNDYLINLNSKQVVNQMLDDLAGILHVMHIRDRGQAELYDKYIKALRLLGETVVLCATSNEIRHGFTHGDFSFNNVVVADGGLCVIDWESYMKGPYYLSMARFYSSSGSNYDSIKSGLMRAIGTDLSPNEVFMFIYSYIIMSLNPEFGTKVSYSNIDKALKHLAHVKATAHL